MGIRERWGGSEEGEVRICVVEMRWGEGEGDVKAGRLRRFWNSVVWISCTVGLEMGYSKIRAL